MAVNKSEQVVREAADIEAYKLGLLASAKELADKGVELPPQMVAEMSSLQLKAGELAEAGIGQYQPYLDAAAGTLGDAQNVTGSALTGAQALQAEGAGLMRQGAADIPGQVGAAQSGIANALDYGQQATENSLAGLGTAAQNTRGIASQSMADQLAAYDAIPGQVGASQTGMAGAATTAQGVADAAAAGGAGVQSTLASNLSGATKGARTYGQAASDLTSDASAALQKAGAFGQQTAEQGIAGLAGTTGAYDPASTGAFMNQYEDAAVQQALADVQRAGDIQQQGAAAQAVGAGAFGGSRAAVQEAEIGRNILEQQGRTAAGMRQAGFESAANRSQQAFEAQQGRTQGAAQLTGALGAQGSGAALNAAQSAGQLGIAASTAGMQSEQQAAANAQALAQTGMSLEQLASSTGMSAAQLAGQLAQQSGQLGLQGAQAQSGIAAQAGQMGMAGEQFAGQMAGQAGQLGQGQAQMTMQGAQAGGQLGLQGTEMAGRMGEGIAGIGATQGQMGLQQGSALKDIAMAQGQMGEANQALAQKEQGFLFDMGKQYQAQDQATLEAARQTKLQKAYEPYQRVGFLSDIYKGAPSSQSTITATTTPNVSSAQSILGLGVAGLSAAAGARQGGLF